MFPQPIDHRPDKGSFLLSEYALFFLTIGLFVVSSSFNLVWYLNYYNIVAAILVCWEILLVRRRISFNELVRYFVPVLLFLVLLLLHGVLAPIAFRTVYMVGYVVVLALLFYVVTRDTGRTWPFELGAIVALVYLFVIGNFGSSADMIKGGRLFVDVGGDEKGLNPNVYAFYWLIGISFACKFYTYGHREINVGLHRLFWATCYLVITAMGAHQILMVTGSRKGVLVLGYLFLMWIYLSYKSRRLFFLFAIGSASILGFWVAGLGESMAIERLDVLVKAVKGESYYVTESSYLTRSFFYQEAFKMWLSQPIFGKGIEAFRLKFGTYSHSNFMELLANYGLLGFVLFYLWYFQLYKLLLRPLSRRTSSSSRLLAYWGCGVIIMYLIWQVAAVSYYERVDYAVLGVLIGVLSRELVASPSSRRSITFEQSSRVHNHKKQSPRPPNREGKYLELHRK